MERHKNDQGYGICPVCFEGLLERPQAGLLYNLVCPRCGSFRMARVAAKIFQTSETLGQEGSRNRAKLSSWIRENRPSEIFDLSFFNTDGSDPLYQLFISTPEPSYHQKADKLLQLIRGKTEFAGQSVKWHEDEGEFIARSWSLNIYELCELFGYLRETKRTKGGGKAIHLLGGKQQIESKEVVKIEAEGWAHLESLKANLPSTDQAFVAMWFNDEMLRPYAEAFHQALEDAGYSPIKIDLKEHNNRIDDELIAEIRKSKFLIADLTNHRGGVYYEAGFAHGLSLPVIWTCREDHFKDRHFDVRQYNCIKWEEKKLEGLREALQNRIEATIGRGNYIKPN